MRRGHAGLWIGMMVAVAAMPQASALAQSTDATSRQNVASTAPVADRAALEARRTQLFQLMLAQPANLDLAFEYAALSERLGDLEAAISTLERMLIFAPGLPRLQFELGVLYYRLGSWNTAKSYFTTVLEQPQVPDDIRNRIGQYMGRIEAEAEGARSFGEIGIGLRYQTNANAGPSSPFVDIGGLPFELDPDALSTADYNGYVTGRFHNSIDLAGQGDRFEIDVSAYGALYANENQLDTGIVEISLGPDYNLAAIGMDNARLALHADFGTAVLGGEFYLASAGLGADLNLLLDARNRLTFSGKARHEAYFDSEERPNASDRTGQVYSTAARHQYLLTPDIALTTGLQLSRTQTGVDYLSNWAVEATAGLIFSLDSPVDGGEDWALTVSGGTQYRVADAADPVVSTDAEVRTVSFISAGVIIPIVDQLALNSSLTYSLSDSNYDMSNYDNLAASVGLSKKF